MKDGFSNESAPGKHDTTRRPTFLRNKTENSTVMRSHSMLYHAWWTAPSAAHLSHLQAITTVPRWEQFYSKKYNLSLAALFWASRRRSDQTSVWLVNKSVWYHLSNVWICMFTTPTPPPTPLYLQPGLRLGKGEQPQTHACKSARSAPELRIVSHLCGSAAISAS